MCNYLFVGSDGLLPEVAWNENSPGFYVAPARESEATIVRAWFTKPFLYDVGSHMGCACPFADEVDWDNPTEADLAAWCESREDFRQLAAYLQRALLLLDSVEVYNAFDYWEAPARRRSIVPHDLLQDRFVFEEREFVTVRST